MSTMYVNNIAPLEGNTINVASGNTLYAPGSVVQVVRSVYSTSTEITTNSYVDTGLTANITPKSASSRILIFANIKGLFQSNNGQDVGAGFKIFRGATTELFGSNVNYEFYFFGSTGVNNYRGAFTFNTEDTSHNSTTELTYKVQVGAYNADDASTQLYIHQSGSESTLILMEIAQ